VRMSFVIGIAVKAATTMLVKTRLNTEPIPCAATTATRYFPLTLQRKERVTACLVHMLALCLINATYVILRLLWPWDTSPAKATATSICANHALFALTNIYSNKRLGARLVRCSTSAKNVKKILIQLRVTPTVQCATMRSAVNV